METIITILGIACMSCLIINTNWYVGTPFDRKPFNCAMCFTFWYSIGITLALFGPIGICYSANAAIIAEMIDRKLNYRN